MGSRLERHRLGTVILIVFALSAGSAHASAWIGGQVGYSTYSMSELNDVIAEINADIYPYKLDELSGGWGFGAQAGLDVAKTVALLVGYERLTGETEIADYSGRLSIEIPANVFKGGVEFTVPSTQSFSLAIGGLAGLLSTSGGADLSISGVGGESADYEGTGLLLEGYIAGVYWTPARSFCISPQLGYRYANISDPEADGVPLLFDLDYSGVIMRVVARFSFIR